MTTTSSLKCFISTYRFFPKPADDTSHLAPPIGAKAECLDNKK